MKRKVILGVLIGFALVAVPWLINAAKAVSDAKKSGILDDVETDKYKVGRENNLKAIQKALLQAADSDGTFPAADKWMDQALLRLKTSDISEDEAKDKLRVPGLKPREFGYAINDGVAGKSLADIKDKSIILVFESTNTAWNAHGDPAKEAKPGGKLISVDGTVTASKSENSKLK